MPLSLSSPLDNLRSPAPTPDRVAFLGKQAYAHRGLHAPGGHLENSRAAFIAAIDQGYGIELDVQASRDGELFVFHDATLDRLTRATGRLDETLGADIARITLNGTQETIPRFEEILKLVAGRKPILIEVKTSNVGIRTQCLAVRRALEGYRGHVAIMSFHPDVGRWFHEHAPRIVRGLVITETGGDEAKGGLRKAIERRLSLWHAKPDFLAYDIRDLPSRFAASQRKRGLPVLTWTVRTPQHETTAAQHADEIIFEHVGPHPV
jgi:glycerophosphoryl diester phosphodiesterase